MIEKGAQKTNSIPEPKALNSANELLHHHSKHPKQPCQPASVFHKLKKYTIGQQDKTTFLLTEYRNSYPFKLQFTEMLRKLFRKQ
jgi:hypothetical protein